MSTIYLVHGFNVRDGGTSTTYSLRQHLLSTGHKVVQLKYGHVGRMGVRACNDNVAHMLASLVTEDDYIVAHSNGAAIVYDAARLGMKAKGVWLINPALDSGKGIMGTWYVRVFYSPSDPWTRLARWIPFSTWGNQGQIGYTGWRTYYRQTNNDFTFGEETGHSGVFANKYRRQVTAATIRGDIDELDKQ